MNKFETGNKVIVKRYGYGIIFDIFGNDCYVVHLPTGFVCYASPENLTKVEEKGMSEFKVGDVVKFNNNGLFYKIVYLSKECVVTNKLNDEDNKISSKQETGFAVNSPLYLSMELATDEWVSYQGQQKAKEESKAVSTILKELAGQIENGEVHVFTEEFDYSKTRVVGGHAISLKFEGISK